VQVEVCRWRCRGSCITGVGECWGRGVAGGVSVGEEVELVE
jgi:hypothetical protein